MKILVINAGSSSLKYQLIDMETESVMAKGLCERIGIDGHLKHSPLVGGKPVFDEDLAMPTHAEAIAAVIDKLTSAEYGVVASMKEIDAVGHRVVHGGEKFACSVLIDDTVMEGALREIMAADCLIIAGTSLAVYPAAGLIYYFKGKHLVVINRDATPQDANAELVIHDRISTALL